MRYGFLMLSVLKSYPHHKHFKIRHKNKKVRALSSVRTITIWSWKRDLNTRPAHYECAALPTEPYQHNVLRCSTAKIILYFAEKIKRKISTPAQKQNRTAGLTKSPAIWKKRISQQTRAPDCDPNCQIGKYRSALDPARKSQNRPCPPAF